MKNKKIKEFINGKIKTKNQNFQIIYKNIIKKKGLTYGL